MPHPLIRDDGSIDLDILKHDEKSDAGLCGKFFPRGVKNRRRVKFGEETQKFHDFFVLVMYEFYLPRISRIQMTFHFLKVNHPKNKAFSKQNKGHLGSDIYIYIRVCVCIIYNSMLWSTYPTFG